MVLLGVFAIFSRVVKPPFSIPSTACLFDLVLGFVWPMSNIVIPKRTEPIKLYFPIKIKFNTLNETVKTKLILQVSSFCVHVICE